jgi:hypothetical protein
MCNFNAEEMLRRRRLTAQDMTISLNRAGELIREIDDARWHHEETTGCTCWQEALAQHHNPAVPTVADKNRVAQ